MLADYRDARRGPTIVLVQSPLDPQQLCQAIPALEEFPRVLIPSLDRCIVGEGKRGRGGGRKEGGGRKQRRIEEEGEGCWQWRERKGGGG